MKVGKPKEPIGPAERRGEHVVALPDILHPCNNIDHVDVEMMGTVVSEFHPGLEPRKEHRIIRTGSGTVDESRRRYSARCQSSQKPPRRHGNALARSRHAVPGKVINRYREPLSGGRSKRPFAESHGSHGNDDGQECNATVHLSESS